METYMLLINNHKYDRSIKCIIYMPKYKFIEFTYHKSEKNENEVIYLSYVKF